MLDTDQTLTEGDTQITDVTDTKATDVEPGAQDSPEPKGEADAPEAEDKAEPSEPSKTDEALAKAIAEAKQSVKGGYEGTVKELKTKLAKLEQEREDALARLEETKSEAQLGAFIRGVEDAGGDTNIAQQIAERIRTTAKKERDLAVMERRLQGMEQVLSAAGKAKRAHDLITEYSLPKERLTALMEAADDTTMENLALKFHLKGTKTAATKATKVDDVSAPGAKPLDLSTMSDEQALGLAASGKI